MTHFGRIAKYFLQQKQAVIISIVCAILVGVLFSVSITAMLPLMKVMIGEEGLHGWIYRNIVLTRTGMGFAMIPPEEIPKEGQPTPPVVPLRITDIRSNTPAAQAGLLPFDTILSVTIPGQAAPSETNPSKIDLLETIVNAVDSVEITVEHETGQTETLPVTLEESPFYTGTALWALSTVPRDQSLETKIGYLKIIIFVIMVTTALRCILRFTQQYLVHVISFRTIQQLRNDTYSRALRLPLNYFGQEGISDTISRFVQDTNRVKAGLEILLGKTILEPIKIIMLGIMAYKVSPKMTIFIITIGPVAAMTLNRLGKKMKKATKRTLEEWSNLLGHLQGTFLGIRVVKGYHQETSEEKRFLAINQKLLKRQFKMGRIDAAGSPLMEGLSIVGACAGMFFATNWIMEGMISVSNFFALIVILGTMAESGRKLGDVWTKVQTANASAERVYQLYDREIEQDAPDAIALPRLTETIEFCNLGYTYPRSLNKTLDGINLKVTAGQTIAVVGPNGSGKTTLLSMIPRFFIADEGRILFDGRDIANGTLESLRTQIGIVPQQPIVFHESIAANIAYSKPGATQDEIVAAARQAFAHDFILNTPNGYDTIIGEQGATLSGGQLQRIAIARAILRDPAILIFDEAMSQIDSESEQKIQQAIRAFSQGRTSFIIAHRLSTVIDSDVIVVLDNGQLVDQGTHQELLQKCALYKQLYNMQFGGIVP